MFYLKLPGACKSENDFVSSTVAWKHFKYFAFPSWFALIYGNSFAAKYLCTIYKSETITICINLILQCCNIFDAIFSKIIFYLVFFEFEKHFHHIGNSIVTVILAKKLSYICFRMIKHLYIWNALFEQKIYDMSQIKTESIWAFRCSCSMEKKVKQNFSTKSP